MITDEETYIEIVNGLFELISNGMWCSLEFDILSETRLLKTFLLVSTILFIKVS